MTSPKNSKREWVALVSLSMIVGAIMGFMAINFIPEPSLAEKIWAWEQLQIPVHADGEYQRLRNLLSDEDEDTLNQFAAEQKRLGRREFSGESD